MGNTHTQFKNSCNKLTIENITDINEVVFCAQDKSLVGLASHSASSTDQYLFTFRENTFYNGKVLLEGFQKVFLTNPRNETTKTQIYEYYILMNVIKPILRFSINPHFVKILGGKLDVNFNSMKKYLSVKSNISLQQMEQNLLRNTYYMDKGFSNRPSITDSKPLEQNEYNGIQAIRASGNINNLRYGFLLTESHDIKKYNTFQELSNMADYTTVTFYTICRCKPVIGTNEYNEWLKIIHTCFFQILTACYTLYLSGTNHNDLHLNNILVQKIPSKVNTYYINDKMYKIESPVHVMLFDFDRSYHVGYTNPGRHGATTLSKYRDCMKVICELIRHVTEESDRQKLLYILTSDIYTHQRILDIINRANWCTIDEYNNNLSDLNDLPQMIDTCVEQYGLHNDDLDTDDIYVMHPKLFKNYVLRSDVVLKRFRILEKQRQENILQEEENDILLEDFDNLLI
jgi:hypothetical protein